MKKILVLILISIFTGVYGQNKMLVNAQIKAEYLCSFLIDTTDTYSLQNEMQTVLLDTVNKRQVFLPEGKFRKDSLFQNNGDLTTMVNNFSRFRSIIPFAVYVDEHSRQAVVTADVIKNEKVFYRETYRQPQWTLTDSTKIWHNVVLKKATTHYKGKDWTAWYAPSIQIPAAPYKFKGLPGLVVQLYDKKKFYEYTLQKLEKKPVTYILDLSEGQEISPVNFFREALKTSQKAALMYLSKFKVKIQTKDGKEISPQAKKIRFNNEIELY